MTAGGEAEQPWLLANVSACTSSCWCSVVTHPGIGSVKTGLERLFKEATVAGDKEDV